ncbi:MAG: DNA-directed RNA polymerase subunit omega [Planctomycetes bacterium]|nr:DNA-directed RNA polymerase subunit omega [Planctomycetota bacterium]
MDHRTYMKDMNFDELSKMVGGRFRLCSMVIKRARQMLLSPEGSASGKLNSQIIREALQEIRDGRVALAETENLLPAKEKESQRSGE